MKENIPVKQIPLPSYPDYRQALVAARSVDLPLKEIPALQVKDLPPPLNKKKAGWPWDTSSNPGNKKYKLPKISVIIPSYQQGAYIEEAIRSVLLQNYPAIELIIMDGGSTDDTLEVINHYIGYISLFVSEKDRGQSHALNKGFSVASGELYYWLNSDDYLMENSFHRLAALFLNDNNLDIVYGDGYSLTQATGVILVEPAPLVLERYLRFGGIVFSHSIMWRSRVHCPIWEDLNCAMDAELWLRLFTGRKFKHCMFPIAVSRIHTEQKTASGSKWAQKWKDDYDKYIWVWYPGVNKWKLRVREYRIVQHLFQIFRKLTSTAY